MIEMEVDQAKLSEIYRVAHQLNLSGRRQLWIATSKAAQDGKSFIAKRMTKRLGQPQKSIRDMMTIRTTGETGSSLTIKKEPPHPAQAAQTNLEEKGVSYKPGSAARVMIDGAFMGPKHPARFLRFAQGHVFIRKDYTPGAKRRKTKGTIKIKQRKYTRNGKTYVYQARVKPDTRGTRPPRPKGYWRKYTTNRKISKLYWASITAVFVKEKIDAETLEYLQQRLKFQINERLRVLQLKSQGKILSELK
jgi:hypothetical protein